MTTIEILKAARKKIERPENWTQGFFAVDASSRVVNPRDPSACKWCMVGVVESISPRRDEKLLAYGPLYRQVGGNLALYNDTHTHAEVLAAFDAAIDKLEGKVES